jgi:hypothetical protein
VLVKCNSTPSAEAEAEDGGYIIVPDSLPHPSSRHISPFLTASPTQPRAQKTGLIGGKPALAIRRRCTPPRMTRTWVPIPRHPLPRQGPTNPLVTLTVLSSLYPLFTLVSESQSQPPALHPPLSLAAVSLPTTAPWSRIPLLSLLRARCSTLKFRVANRVNL